MDFEQRLRESLVAPDPGVEFADGVMARVGQRASWRRRTSSGSGGWSRRRNRLIVIGIVVVGVAAAMLALRLYAVRQHPVVTAVAAPSPPVDERAVYRVEAPAGIPPAQPKVANNVAEHAPEVAPPLPPAAPTETPVRYTVVAKLRQDATDPDARAAVATFFGQVLDELRRVPGLALRVQDAANPVPPGEGEYGLTIASLATALTSTGFTSYRTSFGQGSFNGSTLGNPWPVEWRTDGGGPPTQMRSMSGTPLLLARNGAPRPSICLQSSYPEMGTGTLCLTGAELAAREVEKLRGRSFPLDSSVMQLFAARIGDRSLPEQRRTSALNELLLAARRPDSTGLDSGGVAAIARLVADLPSARQQVWRLVRGHVHPGLVVPLLDSVHSSTDVNARQEALTTLVSDYSSDPRVRAGLQAAASDEPDEFLRALASYPVTGMDGWLAYVRQNLKKENLSPAERLRPLGYISDEAQGAFQKTGLEAMAKDAAIADAVLAIARATPAPASVDQTSVANVGAIRRAAYALTRPDAGPIVPGSSRQELQALYSQRPDISSVRSMMENLGRQAQGPTSTTPPQ